MRTYLCIDLKSFYASVECVERGLDPLGTNLLVADPSRTEKTICLALSPSLKALGLPGRPRLFQVVQHVKKVNEDRLRKAPGRRFAGSSWDPSVLEARPEMELTYITAPPRMALYMDYSARIHRIYLNRISPDDIHVYSVDEVFIDLTPYLSITGFSPRQMALTLIRDVLKTTGITATAGIGTNPYLAKVAMDILAKRIPADKDGVRIVELGEKEYRRQLWSHRPITDFWRVGKGYSAKLEKYGILTMGDVARCSIGKPSDRLNQNLLYRLFGVNAELLIDHAWGYEPCTMADIKAYEPEKRSMVSGQVLKNPCGLKRAGLIVREMADQLALDLADKGLVTDQIVLTLGYDIKNLTDPSIKRAYAGEVVRNRYGRDIPKHSCGTGNIPGPTASSRLITDTAMAIFDRIANPILLVRRISICAGRVTAETWAESDGRARQLGLFTDYDAMEKEKKIQKALLAIKRRYGKNAILKGMNFMEGSTARERNSQIGGHKA